MAMRMPNSPAGQNNLVSAMRQRTDEGEQVTKGTESLLQVFRRKPKQHRGKVGYPRLIATVREYGDVILRTDPNTPEQFEKWLWNDKVPEWLWATSVWHYGPERIRVRASAVVATRIEER